MEKPVFVLIHGAWHSAACWQRVASLLRVAGHTVLTPDLPGHGDATLPLARVTLQAYVGALLELLQGLSGRAILVAHSMAGIPASAAAAALPSKVHRLVYLCAYLPRNGDSLFELVALNRGHEPLTAIELAIRMSEDKRSCTVDAEQIAPLFYSTAPPHVVGEALQGFGAQATLPLSAQVQFDQESLARVPRTYMLCTRDRVIPLHHQRRMLARQSCDELLQMDSDHSPFYSQPEQLAALLAACAN